MLQKIICLLFLVIITSSFSVHAEERKKWSVGISGGGNYGLYDGDESGDTTQTAIIGFGTVAWAFDPHFALRLDVGAESRKLKSESESSILPYLNIIGEIHPRAETHLFDPYIYGGINIPGIFCAGVGNQFNINKNIAITAEAQFNLAPLFGYSGEGHVGLRFSF